MLNRILRIFGLELKRSSDADIYARQSAWTQWGRWWSDSGQEMDPHIALTYSSVWQAVNMISSDVSTLPLNVYRRAGEDRDIQRIHPAHWLLNGDANEFMSSLTLRQIMQAHVLLWGNAYAWIERMGSTPVRLVPLLPDRTWPEVIDGQLIYFTRMANGELRSILPENMLHLKGLGFDGLSGYSVVSMAANSFGLGLTLEKHASRFFANGAMPGIALKTAARLQKQDADALLAHWIGRHGGADNANRVGLLHGGLDLVSIPVNNQDSQFLESRTFTRVEVASWFNIPPHRLGDSTTISYKSVEEANRVYVTGALRPWMKIWEDESERKLLRDSERRSFSHFIEHNDQALLQGDTATVADVLTKLRGAKIITANEARRKLNMNGIADGDELENPATSSGASQPPEQPDEQPEPQPEADPDDARDDAMTARIRSALAAHRNLVGDRARKLLHLEADRVRRAAKEPGKFCAFLDKFYDDQLPTTWEREFGAILATVEAIAGSSPRAEDLARAHAGRSKSELLTLAGTATSEDLAVKVDGKLAEWHVRINDVTNQVFGEAA